MLGAIIGDIVGSAYEHQWKPMKQKDFPWFTADCHFTDDTVTTIAVADALMLGKTRKCGYLTPLRDRMRYWCRQYRDVGFGGYFRQWFLLDDAEPYGSYGNGAAMRVSPVAWVGKDLDEVQELAELTAAISHDHDEAIRGAVAVASAIYLARTKRSKEDIRAFIQQYFYPLQQTLDDIRPTYAFTSDTAHSVPEAIEAFLESTSFIDAIANAVSLGGDTDTQAAMAGAIAEAYYGIPAEVQTKALAYIPQGMQQVIQRFYDTYRI